MPKVTPKVTKVSRNMPRKATAKVRFTCPCGHAPCDPDVMIRRLVAVDPDEWVKLECSPGGGFSLRARKRIRKGQLLGHVRCNVGIEAADTYSRTQCHDFDFYGSPAKQADLTEGYRGAGKCEATLKSLVGEVLRYGNLPDPPRNPTHPRDTDGLLAYVHKHHNVTLVQVEDWMGWGVKACKNIRKHERIASHYGECSGDVMCKVLHEHNTD
jgi:hypothetical protein